MKKAEKSAPLARREDLVIHELKDEVLVYDLTTHRAHCLNRAAALVWSHCDGKTSIAEMSGILQRESQIHVDEAVILLALHRLGKANLLEARAANGMESVVSRRDLLRRLGRTAAALPLVTSIAAATAASTATCIPGSQCGPSTCNQPCHTTGSTDCTKVCRPRGDKANNCNDPRAWQCVGIPAGPCDC